MSTTERKPYLLKTVMVVGLCIMAIALSASLLRAESNWLLKGRDLLQSMGLNSSNKELSSSEIGAGLKEALRVGSENVVNQLGRVDGFNKDAAIHIPLPDKLRAVRSALQRVGMSGLLDDLELKINRAAEVATPKARKLFVQAIAEMTISDVEAIYKGPDDSATQYFKKKMSPALAEEMRPVVESSLAEVGAMQVYDRVMGEYRSLPFMPDVKADLTNYVVQKGMDGIFYYLAKEEAAIRKDPAKQTTDLLRRVFGGQ